MTKLTDIFGRKNEGGEKIIPLPPIPLRDGAATHSFERARAPDLPLASLSEENEQLRSLLSDTGRRIAELGDLKHTFDQLVPPFTGALRELEQEKALAANLAGRLDDQRSAFESLRTEFYAVEAKAGGLQAEAGKLRGELELANEQSRVLERERTDLAKANEELQDRIAALSHELEQEAEQHRRQTEARAALQEQFEKAERQTIDLQTELAAMRERVSLLEADKEASQNSADQALAENTRLSRRLTEGDNTIVALRSQLARLETSFAEAQAERSRLSAALDDAREQQQSERNTLSMRIDALQSRASAAERLLAEARQTLAARTEEVRAFDRKAVDAAIARGAAERRLTSLEGAHDRRERQMRELEIVRNSLAEENGRLGKTLASRDAALARAEEMIVHLTGRAAQLEADLQVTRTGIDGRVEELQAALEQARLDRQIVEGALEGARKDKDRLHEETRSLRSRTRNGGHAAPPAGRKDYGSAEAPAAAGANGTDHAAEEQKAS